MTAAERPLDILCEPSHEGRSNTSASMILFDSATPAETIKSFNKFYGSFCHPESQRRFDSVLSLGEIGCSIVIARTDSTIPPDEPDAYLIKQYDVETGENHDWDVLWADDYSGRGDHFKRILHLVHAQYPAAAQLHLASHDNGTYWQSNTEQGHLNDARMLPYSVKYERKRQQSLISKSALTLVHSV